MTSHTIFSPQSPTAKPELGCPYNVAQRHSATPSKERYMEWSHRADNSTPTGRLLAPDSRAESEKQDRHRSEADDRVCGRYCFSRVYWFCVRSVTLFVIDVKRKDRLEGERYITSENQTPSQVACQLLFIVFKKMTMRIFGFVNNSCLSHLFYVKFLSP